VTRTLGARIALGISSIICLGCGVFLLLRYGYAWERKPQDLARIMISRPGQWPDEGYFDLVPEKKASLWGLGGYSVDPFAHDNVPFYYKDAGGPGDDEEADTRPCGRLLARFGSQTAGNDDRLMEYEFQVLASRWTWKSLLGMCLSLAGIAFMTPVGLWALRGRR
jgi:hypothetical protein